MLTDSKIVVIATFQCFDLYIQVYNVSPGFTAPSVSVLSDKLYVTRGEELLIINKFTGEVLHKEDLGTGNVTVASIYHPVLYDTQDVGEWFSINFHFIPLDIYIRLPP